MVHKDAIDKLQKLNAEKRRLLRNKEGVDVEGATRLSKEIAENERKIKYLQKLTQEEILEKFWRYLGLQSPTIVRVIILMVVVSKEVGGISETAVFDKRERNREITERIVEELQSEA